MRASTGRRRTSNLKHNRRSAALSRTRAVSGWSTLVALSSITTFSLSSLESMRNDQTLARPSVSAWDSGARLEIILKRKKIYHPSTPKLHVEVLPRVSFPMAKIPRIDRIGLEPSWNRVLLRRGNRCNRFWRLLHSQLTPTLLVVAYKISNGLPTGMSLSLYCWFSVTHTTLKP